MAINGKFKAAVPINLNGACAYENEIKGFPHKVVTWRGPLTWHQDTCLVDKSVIAEKRDRFHKRSDVCCSLAEAGSFEWSLAFCPNVDGQQNKRPVHCQLCGALHNWTVFYRRTSDGSFLGFSGCDCFHEVLRNIDHPAADAVAQTAKEEKARCEKFRKTMEKVNDFKRDFPGLYEHREWLRSPANAYNRLWQEVENQLNRAEGVDEKFLERCTSGELDRTYRYRRDTAARRLPGFLKWASKTAVSLDTLKSQIAEASYADQDRVFHRERTGTQPAAYGWRTAPPVAPVAPVKTQTQHDAEELTQHGFGWSGVVQSAAAGKPLSPNAAKWFNETLLSVRKKDDTKEPVEGKAPISEPQEFSVQVGED